MRVAFLLPIFSMIFPANGNEINVPIEIYSSTNPQAESFTPNASLMVGILEAHEADIPPKKKNRIVTAIRAKCFVMKCIILE